jgi:threonine/homoserine/homoserine lactone efflux protein
MLSNPLPILVISAALSGITGDSLGIAFTDIPRFALGLFLGSLLWSPLLVNASSWIRPMIQPQHLALVNRVCGALIVCCGLALGAASLAAYSM